MWFFVGIVSLVAAIGYSLWVRFNCSLGFGNKDESRTSPDGQQYYFGKEKEGRFDVRTKFRIALPAQKEISFRIHRETSVDRFAKSIGLSLEHQFGDADFDEQLYVVSDCKDFMNSLSLNGELRDELLYLFRQPWLRRIECYGKYLVARVTGGKNDDASPLSEKDEQRLVQALQALTVASKPSSPEDRGFKPGTFAFRAAIITALASSLLLYGTSEFYLFFIKYKFVSESLIDEYALVKLSTVIALALLTIYIALTVLLLKGSSFAHVVLMEVLLSGGIGLLLGVFFLLQDANIEFDASQARSVVADVVGRHTTQGRKSGTHYWIDISGNDGNRELPEKIEVNKWQYEHTDKGQEVVLQVHDGALRYRWLESFSIREKSNI